MSNIYVRRPEVGNLLFGRKLATEEAPHQTISKTIGLAVFASDALSSVAYATQEILIILALAGTAYFGLSIPISFVIVGLLIILTISYRQTIYAYPGGGGAYIVAHDNLGDGPALTAGAALLTDYILTVAVSISSGVAQITSAFPVALPVIASRSRLGSFALITIINLRGVKESGSVFAVPTYFFVVDDAADAGRRFLAAEHRPAADDSAARGARAHAAAAVRPPGAARLCQWLYGPHRRRGHLQRHHGFQGAAQQERRADADVMSALLGVMFIGITVLANQVHVIAGENVQETVISQIARSLYGISPLYYITLAATTLS